MNKKNVGKVVREAYGRIARQSSGCGCGCGPAPAKTSPKQFAQSLGYTERELSNIPAESNLGLSCGNPVAVARLKKGEVVLDLGSGAGFDCFIAARQVGQSGKVIGVDMTPEMIEKARTNASHRVARHRGAARNKVVNVEFRLGEIENLPLADRSVDVVISNCVINLSADKRRVFQELYRVLKPGGRVAISDMALRKTLPAKIRNDLQAYTGCVAGAILIDEYKKIVSDAGLRDVAVTPKNASSCLDSETKDPIARTIVANIGGKDLLDEYVSSVYISARKPR